jgi:hypothetical protein
MMLMLLFLSFLACSGKAEGDGYPTEEVEPAEDLGTLAEPLEEIPAEIPEPATDPEPIPLEVLAAEAEPLEELPGTMTPELTDPVIVDTSNVLLSEVLHTLPPEERILAEVIVKQTVSILAENGRLNPGEGAIPGRAEKLIVLGLAVCGFLASIYLRMRTPAPARIAEDQLGALSAIAGGSTVDLSPLTERIKELEALTARQSAQLADYRSRLQARETAASAEPPAPASRRAVASALPDFAEAGRDTWRPGGLT